MDYYTLGKRHFPAAPLPAERHIYRLIFARAFACEGRYAPVYNSEYELRSKRMITLPIPITESTQAIRGKRQGDWTAADWERPTRADGQGAC